MRTLTEPAEKQRVAEAWRQEQGERRERKELYKRVSKSAEANATQHSGPERTVNERFRVAVRREASIRGEVHWGKIWAWQQHAWT